MDRLFSARYSVIVAIVLFAAFSRMLPHPPNFTAIGAMALFAGAFLPVSIAWLLPMWQCLSATLLLTMWSTPSSMVSLL